MVKLVVRLLGGFRVELDGEVVYDFETDKARALLAYLVVEADRPHRRETLASLLWPDQPDTVARARLRQTLYRVRQALGGHRAPGHGDPPFLFVTPTDVQFNTASDYSLDVAELEAFAGRAGPARRELLPPALCADFLAGFSIPDGEPFEAWVLSKQEQCHRLAIEILDAQGTSFEASGDYQQAIAAARLQLQLEPWLEEAHRGLMRCLALAGRQDEALHQYEACCRALRAELDAEPNAATQALYAGIRTGRFPADASRRREVGRVTPPVRAIAPAQTRPSSGLVARVDELEQLNRHLEAALRGETTVALVSGDPGSGKTALLEAFAASALAEHPDLLVASTRCSPGGGLDAFAPLRRLAEMLFGDPASEAGWRPAEPFQADRLQRATGVLLGTLAQHGPDLVDTLVPAFSVARRSEAWPSTHGVANQHIAAGSDRYLLMHDHTGRRPLSQGALLDQLLRTLAAIGRKHPLLLLFDDLHWVDDASAAFLLRFGREVSHGRLFVLGAYRSTAVALGRRDPQTGETVRHPLVAVINELRSIKGEILVDLDRADGRAFVEALLDTEPNRLGARFRDALYAQTGGQALFTVESLRNLQGRGKLFQDEAGRWVAPESLDWGALPARVEATIAERIDRLPEAERRILSAASVQGDDFTGEMVAELIGLTVPEILACLGGSLARQHHLVRPEGLQRASAEPKVRSAYRFAHHLFQKYLYDQLDPVERVQWHAAVASALERQVAGDPAARERLSPTLAWHYEAGGLPLQAARALHDAGRQAMRVSAFREALSRFDHGLALLARLGEPPPEERTGIRQLLEAARLGPQRILVGLGSALTQVTEAGADAAGGDPQGRPQFAMLSWQAEHLMATGRFEEALVVAEQMRAEAMKLGEDDLAGLPHYYSAVVHHLNGNPRESEHCLDWVCAWLTAERQARLRVSTGIDVLGTALAFSALNKWFLGYPEAALARSKEAIDGARGAGNLVGQAAAMVLGASLLYYLRTGTAGIGTIAELSRESHRLCSEHGIRTWYAYAEVLQGWQMVMQGDAGADAGIERMRRAIAEWQAIGITIGTGAYVVILADACLAAAGRCPSGDDEMRGNLLAIGLAAIAPMLGPEQVTCGQSHEAELHRMRGELLLARDGLSAGDEALACFRAALELGRKKGALAWELRAAMSIVRLRLRQGEAHAAELAEARAGLRSIYARFTEGFAYADLQDAAELIGQTA